MKTAGVYPNRDKDKDFLGTARVLSVLRGRMSVMMDGELRGELTEKLGEELVGDIIFTNKERLCSEPDVMIVLGGDGSILEAARLCAEHRVPLLGVNLGRVGYMAELELDELDSLARLAGEDFIVEERMLIEAQLGDERFFALNDAVLGASSIFRMVEIELRCDKKIVNRYRADGIIASTPTGSTAYSLSAGGAVIDPRLDAIMVTPICSHSLNAATLIFSADSELEFRNVNTDRESLWLSVDGREIRELAYEKSIIVRRSDKTVSFIRLKDGGFYEVLRHKMA